MDLKDLHITVGEIMQNPKARQLLEKELRETVTPAILRMASGMRLKDVISLAAGRVPREQIDRLLLELKKI